MTKSEHITFWTNSAKEDEITMNALFKDGRYTHSLFFGHLYMEKLCKALWIKNNNDNVPPYIHNLLKLLIGIETALSDNDLAFLDKLNDTSYLADTPIILIYSKKELQKNWLCYISTK